MLRVSGRSALIFHIFVVGEHRDLKLCTQVDCSNSQPTDDKPFL